MGFETFASSALTLSFSYFETASLTTVYSDRLEATQYAIYQVEHDLFKSAM